jgi:hypothetical protein
VIALGPGIDQLVREYTRVADERKAGAAVLEEPFGKGDADAEIIMNLNKYILPGGYLLLGAGFRPQEIERVFNGLRPFAEPGIVYDAHQLAFKMAKNSVVLTRILKREA